MNGRSDEGSSVESIYKVRAEVTQFTREQKKVELLPNSWLLKFAYSVDIIILADSTN